jgi:hypothetical protein
VSATAVPVFGPPSDAAVSSPNATAVLERALALVAARSPEIACPILDRAVAAGTISSAERAELLGEVVGSASAAYEAPSAEAMRLRHQIRVAIGRAAPLLARPLLDEAVASERLTPAQELRILRRLRRGVSSEI